MCLFEALPALPQERLIDLLEFIASQHGGSSFNPDNTLKALEIAAFVQRRPFAVSASGVASIARLARHALGSSSGVGNSTEHQLWLLTSGALNTAAAIHEFDGDAVRFFDAARRDDAVRGKYLQRQYAQAAMEAHVAAPDAYAGGDEGGEGAARAGAASSLSPLTLACAGFGIVLAVFLGMLLTADGMVETLVSSTLRRSGTP